jgi:hypothetical protein
MSTRTWWAALVVAATAGWLGNGAFSDEAKPAGGAPSAADHAAMEKMMEELGKPGDMHAWLAKFNGRWSVRGEFTEMDGSKSAMTGGATFSMTLGGRFSEQRFAGFWKGKRFDGRGFTGYDNGSKKFDAIWLDTMSTSPSISHGQLSADGKSLETSGVWEMPGMKMPFKFVTTWVNDRQFTFTMMMDMGDGKMAPMGVLTYCRCC